MEDISKQETQIYKPNIKGKLLFFGKIFFVGILLLVLLIPMQMIRALVRERQQRQSEAIQEVAATWGGRQIISGPILWVPYRFVERDAKNKIVATHIKDAYFLPENLNVKAQVDPQIRYRGIFKIPLYNAKASFEGHFFKPDFSEWNISEENILWDNAKLLVGISDVKAIREKMEVTWQDAKIVFQPSASTYVSGSMVEVPIKNLRSAAKDSIFNFAFKAQVGGSENLAFVPLGSQTQVTINSSWTNPSFFGSYLPSERSINKSGFQAQWKTLLLGRNFPKKWLDNDVSFNVFQEAAFGVELKLPVDAYLMTDRAIKYAVLFIFLTFLTYFLFEVFNPQIKTHPVQYLLVGFALCIFYLLLLSLSEYILFAQAYLAAAAATTMLITSYSARILKNVKRSMILASLLAGLYAYLYSLLQTQDYSLLMGSLGLFFILALVMFLTRKIDWYALSLR